MNTLIAELQRLYFLHDQQGYSQNLAADGSPTYPSAATATPEMVAKCLTGEASVALNLLDADGRVRTMAVGFAKATDWERAAKLYQGIQEDLDLPAPAVSVSGKDG